MADITMCPGKKCPRSKSCYRFTAEPNPDYQSYLCEPPYEGITGECDLFWSNKENNKSSKQSKKATNLRTKK
jgi:hypothetical protein